MSKFIESLESRQMASVTPLSVDTEVHTDTDGTVMDYSYHAKGFEVSNGRSSLGFISVQTIQAPDGSTSQELMIGKVVTKKDGSTTLQFIGFVTNTGSPDAQSYVFKTTLSRNANGDILKDITQTKNFK